MKKFFILLIVWYLFSNASEKSDWWIELITDPITGTVTKIQRSDYLEFNEVNEDYASKHIINKSLLEYKQKRKEFKKKLKELKLTIN